MHLIFEEYEQYFVWVKDNDEDYELSPQFDTEEDAQNWYTEIKRVFKGK